MTNEAQSPSGPNPDRLQQRVISWLEHERHRFASAAIKANIPPAATIAVHIAFANDDSGTISTEQQARTVSILNVYDGSSLYSLVRPEFDQEARSLAEEIHILYGTAAYSFSLFTRPAFNDDPAHWIEDRLLAYIRIEYLSRIGSLNHGDPALGHELAGELRSYLERDEVDLVTTLPVNGLIPDPDPVEWGPITLRSLTSEELGLELSSGRDFNGEFPGRKFIHHWPEMQHHTYALVVREPGPKTKRVVGRHLAHRVILALQLLGFEPHGRGQATAWTHPGPTTGISGPFIRIPSTGGPMKCTAIHLHEALKLAKRISPDVFTNPTKQASVSLHRFHLGSADGNPADAVIDFCIALEALLLQQQEAELSYRFRLFGAHYLSQGDASTRREIYKQLREIYQTRSTLVHGGTPPSMQELHDISRRARTLAGQALCLALRQGWPSSSDLIDLVLA